MVIVLGTWELKTDNDRANYYVIEKGDNSDSYLVTYYYIDTEIKKIKLKIHKLVESMMVF